MSAGLDPRFFLKLVPAQITGKVVFHGGSGPAPSLKHVPVTGLVSAPAVEMRIS